MLETNRHDGSQGDLSPNKLPNQERVKEFFSTAIRLASFCITNDIDYRFVGGYAIELLSSVSDPSFPTESPKDIDIVVFEKLSVIKLFRAGYKLKEESPSASDIKAEPEIMTPSYLIFTAEDPKALRYVPIDIFVAKEDSPQRASTPFVITIDSVPLSFLQPTEYLSRLKTYYEEHKVKARYRDPHNGRMESDLKRIARLEKICKAFDIV